MGETPATMEKIPTTADTNCIILSLYYNLIFSLPRMAEQAPRTDSTEILSAAQIFFSLCVKFIALSNHA
jgi:hypothetical protein